MRKHGVMAALGGGLVATLVAGAVAASQDMDGAGDHPDVPRVAGSHIVYQDHVDFDRVAVPVGPYSRDGFEGVEVMEGEVLSLSYVFDNPDVATLRVKRSYLQALERAQSVVSWLAGEVGVARERLQAAGAGMMAPVTTNRTEEGRARNRRVELVEREGDA